MHLVNLFKRPERFALLGICLFVITFCEISVVSAQTSGLTIDVMLRHEQDHESTQKKPPYRPKDGDNMGYSKAESIKYLEPEVQIFLDNILRLYKEPGLFANRREVFAALQTEAGVREELTHPVPRSSLTDSFRQYAVAKGLFARAGWSATFNYLGQEKNGTHWRIRLDISIPSRPACIDSRAVEGYLDLYLYSNLDGKAHLTPPNLWDRHGISGSPFAIALSGLTPGISLGFVGGCLARITLAKGFKYEEISDVNIFD